MKRTFAICAMSIVAFSLFVTPTQAVGDYTLTRIDPADIQSLEIERTPAPCQVGNLNPAAYVVSEWLAPPDKYALIFDPAATCQDCDVGVRITTVHAMLQTSAACELVVKVSLMSVDSPPGANCPAPLDLLCGHYEWGVSVPAKGIWDIALPLDCMCADPNYPLALKVTFSSASCDDDTLPGLMIDAFPSACSSYNLIGGVWTDLVTAFGFPGNLLFWADAECCWSPVAAERNSWGEIKSIYR
jgi:hypothetical protein